MAEGLWKRVQVILKEIGMSYSRLKELMSDRGLEYEPPFMDSFASPDDTHVIAGILGVPASRLFEATNLIGELLKAVFEEEWPKYENRVGMSKQEAWRRVTYSEFRWVPSRSTIRDQVILVLEALGSPSSSNFGCRYPDCFGCGRRCKETGLMMGA